MSNKLIKPGSLTRAEQAAMILTREWADAFKAALTGACAAGKGDAGDAVIFAANVADLAITTINTKHDELLRRFTGEGN